MTLSGRRHRRPLRGATALAPRLRRGFAKKPLASGTGCARELPSYAALVFNALSLVRDTSVMSSVKDMYFWLIGGTDAHAKNHSLLIGAGDEVRLAPPYEIGAARDQALKDGLARSIIVPLSQSLIAHARERLASLAPVTSRSPRLRKKSKTAP
jgi:hypothetical protein